MSNSGRPIRNALSLALLLAACGLAPAIEPVKPNLNPKARVVLNYLQSIYGKRVLAGISGFRTMWNQPVRLGDKFASALVIEGVQRRAAAGCWSPGFSLSPQPKGCTPADMPKSLGDKFASELDIDGVQRRAAAGCWSPGFSLPPQPKGCTPADMPNRLRYNDELACRSQASDGA